MDSELRNKGKKALGTVLKEEKNIDILEKHIYNNTFKKNHLTIIENYNDNLYQVIGDILNEKKLKDILDDIKKNKFGWEHSSFEEMGNFIKEQNDFLQNPFEVEEGVFQCKACGSKRVFSYCKQDRSSDEGMSVYAQCIACKTKWRERG